MADLRVMQRVTSATDLAAVDLAPKPGDDKMTVIVKNIGEVLLKLSANEYLKEVMPGRSVSIPLPFVGGGSLVFHASTDGKESYAGFEITYIG